MILRKKNRNTILGSILIAVGVIAVTAVTFFQISKLRTFQFFGGLTHRVKTDKKIVALTFDDAPTRRTQDVLTILAEKNIKATFYEIGKGIEENPDIAKAVVDAGMEVGNHSYTHTRMVLKSQKFIDEEIQKTNDLIRESGYTGEITFRPPNGKKLFGLPWYLGRHGIRTIMWDIEPDTYVQGDAEAIVRYTTEHIRPGSIILIHPFCEADCAADRKALPNLIDAIHADGYSFVTVSELLSHDLRGNYSDTQTLDVR